MPGSFCALKEIHNNVYDYDRFDLVFEVGTSEPFFC